MTDLTIYKHELIVGKDADVIFKEQMAFKTIYEHKLIVGKGAYVDIALKKNFHPWAKLIMKGKSKKIDNLKWTDSLRKMFDKNPKDLYIPKADFDRLMDIADHFCLANKNKLLKKSLSSDIVDFVESLKTSPKNQKIEDKNNSNDSFSVEINGQTFTFDSEFIKEENIHFVIYRIDSESDIKSYEVVCYTDITSLNRKEILQTFLQHVRKAMENQEYSGKLLGYSPKIMEKVKTPHEKLQSVADLEKLERELMVGKDTNYDFWDFKDAEVLSPLLKEEYLYPATLLDVSSERVPPCIRPM